jgi:putative lipoic acid-binding regulatory protein
MKDAEPDDPLAGTPLEGKKLELDYPCAWTYTVIGEDEAVLREVVVGVVGSLEHTLSFSHASKSGKYRSFELVVTVPSDVERLTIFRLLHEHPDIRYVL